MLVCLSIIPVSLRYFFRYCAFSRGRIRSQKVMGWLISLHYVLEEVTELNSFKIWLLRLVLIFRLCSSFHGFSLLRPLRLERRIRKTWYCGLAKLNICLSSQIDNGLKELVFKRLSFQTLSRIRSRMAHTALALPSANTIVSYGGCYDSLRCTGAPYSEEPCYVYIDLIRVRVNHKHPWTFQRPLKLLRVESSKKLSSRP